MERLAQRLSRRPPLRAGISDPSRGRRRIPRRICAGTPRVPRARRRCCRARTRRGRVPATVPAGVARTLMYSRYAAAAASDCRLHDFTRAKATGGARAPADASGAVCGRRRRRDVIAGPGREGGGRAKVVLDSGFSASAPLWREVPARHEPPRRRPAKAGRGSAGFRPGGRGTLQREIARSGCV